MLQHTQLAVQSTSSTVKSVNHVCLQLRTLSVAFLQPGIEPDCIVIGTTHEITYCLVDDHCRDRIYNELVCTNGICTTKGQIPSHLSESYCKVWVHYEVFGVNICEKLQTITPYSLPNNEYACISQTIFLQCIVYYTQCVLIQHMCCLNNGHTTLTQCFKSCQRDPIKAFVWFVKLN